MTEASDTATDIDAGLAHHEAGRLAQAEALYRRVLEQEPDHPDALNLLGVILQDTGNLTESIAVLSQAVAADPEFPEAFANLARAQCAAGDPAAAKRSSQRAIELDPDLAEAHLQLARSLLALQDDAAVVIAATRAAALAPDSADALLFLGHAQGKLKDYPAAAAAYRSAEQLAPDRYEVVLNLGIMLAELNQLDEATIYCQHAVTLKPDHASAYVALGGVLRRSEDFSGSVEALNQAVERAPDHLEVRLQQGDNYALMGRFDAAADCYNQLLALDPASSDALSRLAAIGKLPDAASAHGLLQATLNDPARSEIERLSAGFALGSLLDKAGNYEAAFATYAAANRLALESFAVSADRFDLPQFRRRLDQLRTAFVPSALEATAGWGNPSEVPVFIVGMPRSGTTLVEQILASHPKVHGASELKDMFEIAGRLEGDAPGLSPATWDPAAVRDQAAAQLARLQALGGSADRVIDKLPDNIMQLGHIAVLFPNARVIICRRDPRDVGLSCFFQRFRDGMAWAYDLTDTAARTSEIERLADHWRNVLPLRMVEINYETLIGDLKGESRRLIDFLGLEWDDACLSFHETQRAVQTASFWQVRQPLYSSSVGRWRHYCPYIQPLLDGLTGLVATDDTQLSVPRILAEARSFLLAGHIEPAESAYRLVIERQPDNIEALHRLGQLVRGRGDPRQAASLLRRAAAGRPGDGESLVELSRAYRAMGDFHASAETASEAVALNESDAAAQFLLGSARLDLNDPVGATEPLQRAIALAPEFADAQHYFAMACMRLKDFRSAAAALREAVRLNPDDAEYLTKFGRVLCELDEYTVALPSLRRAVELAPADGRVHLALVTALWGARDVAATEVACDKALLVAPDTAELWVHSGYCKAARGRFAEAADCYRKAIALEPDLDSPLYGLVSAGHLAEVQPDAARLRNVLDDPGKAQRERAGAGHALGELLDRAGDYDAAWDAYAAANQLARASHQATGRAFDPIALDAYVETIIANFPPGTFPATTGSGNASDLPVFVVGMPRSGTTLVEQIASSHRTVFGAGERDDIRNIVVRLQAGQADPRPIAWDPAAIAHEAAAHLQKLRLWGGDATRVIDKLPDNFQWLGPIAMLFPRARVIICRRDLRDVGLSCYLQHFGDNLPWATSLADIACRAQTFERLVSHWRAVLPLDILEVQYEDLVHNLEFESRRLIEFLGLEWDPACLAFHETERAVTTASQWQVRQPLFTNSIGRWRHYSGHLQPLLAGLAGLVPSDGDADWDSLAAEPAAALTIAVSHHRGGRLDYAEPIYQALLRRDPDDAATLHLLGLLRLDRGQPAEAIALITHSLALRPNVAAVLAALARAHCAGGDAEAAVEVARQAAGLDPNLPEAWAALATALTRLKDDEAATQAWHAALALKPGDPGLLIDFAGSLVQLDHLDQALATYRQAASLAPGDPRALFGVAHAQLHAGDAATAADTCRHALETMPDWSRMWMLLANCEAMRGRFDAAAEAYRRTLALEPGLIDAFHDLVSMEGRFDDIAATHVAQNVLEDPARPVRDRVAAGFALGKIHDRSGAYDQAFAAFALGNRLLRDDRAARGYVFDRNQFRALVDRQIAAINRQTFAVTAGWGNPSEAPVFIVGMPRSGTSLVEQIAASHPLVFGAGEQSEIFHILTTLDGGPTVRRPAVAWDREAVRRETLAHVRYLRGLGGDAVRVIDKQPDNIQCLGQIAVLFPHARIVVCRRDLRDVGLSCFFQYFREDELTWPDDLVDCAFRAREVERLMDHWRKVLPFPILEIDYETLIANPESESRRLIDFLGLEWDPACLAFHETERTVMTASHWQVRQPLYASSVGRWRHYRRHLQPLLAGLAGLVPSDGDDDWDSLASDPATALAIAVSHYQGGRPDHAEPIYRAVLRHNPDDPVALHLLGLLVLDRGDPAESIALITRSLTLRPDLAPVLADLSGAHRAAGNAEPAVEAARHAVAIDPALPVALVQLGYALLMREDTAGAVEALQRATEVAPMLAEAWVGLATAQSGHGNYEGASDAWEVAQTLRPDDPGLLTEFAASLAELKRFEEALAAYRQAETLGSGNPRVQYGIADCLMHSGDVATAADICRQALVITPDARFWLLLANCEAALGHFDAAAEACRQTLALDPASAGALHDLVVLGQRHDDDAVKQAARVALDDPSRLVRDRVSAGFALGQVCDRHGAYDEAFEAYALANRLLREDRNAHGFVFDRDKFRNLVDRQIATFDPRLFAASTEWGDPSEQPVFVVGMPRSGTSLVEQIAASHRLVFGAGEQAEIFGLLTSLETEHASHHPVGWTRSSVRREATAYVQHLRGFGGDAARIIDKQPDNILCLGQIAILFPRARIVVCRRDPRDISLSCFFQYFRDDPLVWTDDQEDCAFRAREIDRLMDHWRKVLPIPILEIQYETLVGNLERESRRLIDFLGLDWDPACLAFHDTERTVMTASHWQVRQPLYTGSIGRWRHYRRHIGPLLRALQGMVPADDYG
ncbi:sulfotransferase [Acidisphaera sp. S103]|uniref:sulfotransferase n=1 Tax=Acidisphaera sp. S103 TaxID=1747223 RepID=UPI00131BCB7E|nr:sulfotransferase [Acidisphaera sp. S103]